MLSGFVIGYAYDNRWKTMTTGEFIKRRLIRLPPMVAIGAVIGALIFYFQGCSVWDVSQVTFISLLVATFVNVLLIPVSYTHLDVYKRHVMACSGLMDSNA